MPEDEWIDVAAAAERHDCSTQTIWRRIRQGSLQARTEKTAGRDGQQVIRTWVRASAPPLTVEQKVAIRKVSLDHLLEREASEDLL